jgi:PPE-repeat protein
MMQAAAGWEALAISLETQADELAASLASLAQMWQGMGSERAIMASMPMVIWLRMLALQAQKRALQATAQAGSYSTAMASTPQLPEIELNHITHGVLEATNFLGVNTVPIGFNEADYARMWDLAATVMSAYEAETVFNATFEPITPPQPIVVPGAAEAAMSMGMASAAPEAGGAVLRDAVFTQVSGQGKAEEVGLKAGRANQAATEAVNQSRQEATQSRPLQQDPTQSMQQPMQMGMQMASQVGSTLGQLPQQLMQGVTQPFQQLTQPLQQVSSLFGQMGGMVGGDKAAQVGLLGATPFSNHPAIGGTGPAAGAGLVRAASLPGAGGTAARTPLMSNLIGKELEPTMTPVSVGAGAAAGAAAAGLAPVGGGGMGGGPMGMLGQRGKSGGNKAGLTAPAPLEQDLSEDEEDDW